MTQTSPINEYWNCHSREVETRLARFKEDNFVRKLTRCLNCGCLTISKIPYQAHQEVNRRRA